MKNLNFGELLEKLLYLSNQKKYSLANELGYDVSYISKWVGSKNLPTSKNINKICSSIASFIVESSNESSLDSIINYFGLDIDEYDKSNSLRKQIEENLKYTYLTSAGKNNYHVYKDTQVEENYNSIVHVNPKLRKKYLAQDIMSFTNKSDNLDLIVVSNIYYLNSDDKSSLSEIKRDMTRMGEEIEVNVKIRMIIDLNRNLSDIVYNTLLIINMLSEYPKLNFELYNCDIDSNTVVVVVKDRLFHSAIFAKSNRYLFTNMSKEKDVVEEVYYTLEDMIETSGKLICDKKSAAYLVKEKIYMQYILGKDLRWVLGSMNEFFMPIDLFDEIVEQVFDDEELIKEMKKINLLLHNITYKSNLRVVMYDSEIRKYISTGNLTFFNIPITLTFEQRQRHIDYISKILQDYKNIEIRLVDGYLVEELKHNLNPVMYLCKNKQIIKTHSTKETSDYLLVKDESFAKICENLFEELWNYNKDDIIINDNEEITERINNFANYTKIIRSNFGDNI